MIEREILRELIKKVIKEMKKEKLQEEFIEAKKQALRMLQFFRKATTITLAVFLFLELRLFIIGEINEIASQLFPIAVFVIFFATAFTYLYVYCLAKTLINKDLKDITEKDVRLLKCLS